MQRLADGVAALCSFGAFSPFFTVFGGVPGGATWGLTLPPRLAPGAAFWGKKAKKKNPGRTEVLPTPRAAQAGPRSRSRPRFGWICCFLGCLRSRGAFRAPGADFRPPLRHQSRRFSPQFPHGSSRGRERRGNNFRGRFVFF